MTTASLVLYKSKRDDVKRLIDCVNNSSIHTLFIVDNSPSDDLRDFVESCSSKIHYFYGQGNVGYGAAHNIAIREAIKSDARYHIVLNPDVFFADGTIETISKYMDRDKTIGQVMPKVFYPDGRLQYLCKLIPTPTDLLFKLFLPQKIKERRMRKFMLEFTGYDKEMNVPYLSGCFMFFRVQALNDIGLFDERFFMYPEDIDITRRMHEKYKTMFFPNASIIHAHAAESKHSGKMLFVHIKNMIKYFNKWGWVFDNKRRETNKKVLTELGYYN